MNHQKIWLTLLRITITKSANKFYKDLKWISLNEWADFIKRLLKIIHFILSPIFAVLTLFLTIFPEVIGLIRIYFLLKKGGENSRDFRKRTIKFLRWYYKRPSKEDRY